MKSVFSLLRAAFCTALAALLSTSAAPRINEFVAENDTGYKDEEGKVADWIEIYNPDASAVNLSGYYLTDNRNNLTKWRFPAGVTLESGAFLVVFASGKDRVNPASRLHTNFQIDRDGEYLGLIAPNGTTVASALAPVYPLQFDNVSFGVSSATPLVWSYYSIPTPNAANTTTAVRSGPSVTVTFENPPQPVTGPLTISARVLPVNGPVASVKLYYRRMFQAETLLNMTDDGAGGDEIAGDGIWSATIPATALAPAEMTRWRIVAADTSATETKDPAYRNSFDYPQYYGTVPDDARIQSKLPVFHWFMSNPAAAENDSGARGAVYYDGEFYDNVLFDLHGQSTAGFPKKSYNIDFHPHYNFRWTTNTAIPRVSDIELLTNWADKSKVRHVLAYEIMREAGVPAHFAFTARVQLNGSFFSTADIVERGDETYLERAGLNEEGALYKVYGNTLNKDAGDTGTSGIEKKTRKTENNNDLQALIDGLDLTGTALSNYIYDNIDLPRCVDMLAANSVIRNIDMHSKNWYIYRDTGRSGEWAILPWDLDLSQGRVWNQENTYFDNALYVDGFVASGQSIRLVAHLFQNPAMSSMIMRRIRTLVDRFLQPTTVPVAERYYERRLDEQLALIDPPSIVPSDARRDFEKWGSWLQAGTQVSYTNPNLQVETMAEAIQRFKTEYLTGRRNYIYNTQIVGKGGTIPLPQDETQGFIYTALVSAGAPAKALVPNSSTPNLNWIGTPTQEPFDTTGWLSGTTGVGYERQSGYEAMIGLDVGEPMRANNTVFVRMEFDVPNPAVYDRLELRMKFDDGFVAYLNGTILVSSNAPASTPWNAAASFSREAPAAYDVFDVTSKKSSLRAGRNVLAIRGLNDQTGSSDMLILPELYGGVTTSATKVQPVLAFASYEVNPLSGNQDQEFIQITNNNSIAVDLSDWKLTGGVEHRFIPGTVIPAKGSLFVCPDSAAFRARTVSPKGGEGRFIQGGYTGHLSNLGETVQLIDPAGGVNATLTYAGQPLDTQLYLVISEVMYSPSGDGQAEYIELLNTSPSVTLDLTELEFTQGIEFGFTNSTIKTLAPGARMLVVRNLASFNTAYGPGLPVGGVFTNGTALNNGGEKIKLEGEDNQTVFEFTYDNVSPWPVLADGGGYSLVLIAPETKPNPILPASWRLSAAVGGAPGAPDSIPYPADGNADANGNGQPDLLDYAMGNDLGKPALFPTVTTELSALRLSYPMSIAADRVRIDVLYSTDLLTWQDAASVLQAGPAVPLGDGRMMMSFTVKEPLSGGSQAYLRLRVTPK